MFRRYVLFIGLCLIMFVGCYEDIEITSIVTQQIEPGVLYRNDIVGVVVDTSGIPVANAQVTLVDESELTDAQGRFAFENVLIDEKGTHLAVANVGYVTTGVRIYPVKALRQTIDVTLVSEAIGFVIDNITGGIVNHASGLTLTFAPESVLSAGKLFEGGFNVNIFFIDPQDDANFEKQLRAYDVHNQVSTSLPKIDPISMAYITVTDDKGIELNINPELPVKVDFPIKSNSSTLSQTLDLLSFDDSNGLWIDEGSAVKDADNYKAELSHFSWWTVSNIVDTKTLCLDFNSSLNEPPGDNIFVINTVSGNHIYFGTVDYDNAVCIPVPSNEELIIKAYKYCVVEVGEITIKTQELGNDPLSFNITENTTGYNISVSINDCNDDPLEGEFEVSYKGQSDLKEVTGSSFEVMLNECFDQDKVDLIIKDNNTSNIYTISVPVNPDILTYDATVKACGAGFPEDEILIIGDEVFSNCKALLNPQEVVVFAGDRSELIGFDELTTGVQSCRIISSKYTGLGEVDISEIGVVGEHIIGRFKAVPDMNGDVIEGVFKALIQR